MRMPGSPSGVVSDSPGRERRRRAVVDAAAVQRDLGLGEGRAERLERLVTCGGVTNALPPPWMKGSTALWPMRAMRRGPLGAGRDAAAGALVAEHDRRAGRRLGEERDDLVARRVLGGAARVERQRLAGESAERTDALGEAHDAGDLVVDDGLGDASPSRTAASRPSPHGPPGPGIMQVEAAERRLDHGRSWRASRSPRRRRSPTRP